MNTHEQNIEMLSLKNTIDDLLILQSHLLDEQRRLQNENEQFKQALTKQRRIIRSLNKQISKEQTNTCHLTAALQAALHQSTRGETNE